MVGLPVFLAESENGLAERPLGLGCLCIASPVCRYRKGRPYRSLTVRFAVRHSQVSRGQSEKAALGGSQELL